MTRVFISYAREDRIIVERLEQDLEGRGFEVWLDSDLLAGSPWREEIIRGITRCDVFVVCMSPESAKSEWVRREIFLARGLNKYIIPVVVRDLSESNREHDEIKWIAEELQFVHLNQGYTEGFKLVLDSISGRFGGADLVFPVSDANNFRMYVEERVRQASSEITLIGTGLNILHREPFLVEVIDRATKGQFRLGIYLADPSSPDVETRLIEEELGMLKPPVGRSGLLKRLDTVIETRKALGNSDRISINLFQHYPTMAYLIIDDEYFVYPYGYATLGNFSPVLHFSKTILAHQGFVTYIEKQVNLIKSASVEAEYYQIRKRAISVDMDRLYALAVYIVPSPESALYQFGSRVLGYDLRTLQPVASAYSEYVVKACDYGFHLTLADVLYFYSPHEVQLARTHLQFLGSEFSTFKLMDMRVQAGFPNPHCISLSVDDPSGALEAIHTELVYRLYRRALGTNYTLANLPLDRDNLGQRAELMKLHYGAPYILKQYRPHFTLLDNVPQEKQSELAAALQAQFDQEVKDTTYSVRQLTLLERKDDHWMVSLETPLGQ